MNHPTWGGRFRKTLDPRVAQFNASLPFDHVLYPFDILGSQTHVKMLAKQHLLSTKEAEQIIKGLELIKEELDQGRHSLDIACEDIHMFIEKLLIDKIGEVGKKLHTGRSRNDQVALDLKLYVRDAGKKIEKLLYQLDKKLGGIIETHGHINLPGYTHLQQAQPIRLACYFGAYSSMFKRDIERLWDWKKRMNFSPLGAGALAGSCLPLDRNFVADLLSFSGIVENTIDAVSDRDYVIEFCSFSSILMMHLSRLSEDLILWSTKEFNFLTLDDAFATGSSLMPNKKNPDVLELIRGKSGRVFGHLMGILTIMKGLPLAYNKDMQEDKENLFDTVNTVVSCLEIIIPFIENLKFNTTHMEKEAKNDFLDATQWVESLVLSGVPFREAHHQVGRWIAEASEKFCTLEERYMQERKKKNQID